MNLELIITIVNFSIKQMKKKLTKIIGKGEFGKILIQK